MTNQYAERDPMLLDKMGNHYCRHVVAMTVEGLHNKADIAAELGYRDWCIASLKAENKRLREVLKAYESFESNLVVSEAAWSGGFAAYPTFTPELYDEWMELQGKRNAALKENGG